MEKQYLMFDVQDERADVIAEVLGNKTCKKILTLLAEKEMSESDIARELGIPANTAHYNIQKLVASGFVETVNKFFWSSKGKKMNLYKLSNKKVVISPKTSFRGVLPAFIVTGLVAIGVKMFSATQKVSNIAVQSQDTVLTKMAEAAPSGVSAGLEAARSMPAGDIASTAQYVSDAVTQTSPVSFIAPWSWFLLGAWAALLIFVLFNMRRGSLN